VRIIIKCPESDSPLRGRIHLRGLSLRPTSNLLQSGGGPYISNNYGMSLRRSPRAFKASVRPSLAASEDF